jgi:AhpD family alkylhydroperoxidase
MSMSQVASLTRIAISARRPLAAAFVGLALVGGVMSLPARSEDAPASAEATYKDIEATLGGVPTFIKTFPKAGVAGAWQELKGLEFGGDTALPVKVKALIGIAVAAQIPCEYCVWADTETARQAGATDEEIAEAVAVAAISRHWSTFFHGMQIDFETFKKELGGEMAAK